MKQLWLLGRVMVIAVVVTLGLTWYLAGRAGTLFVRDAERRRDRGGSATGAVPARGHGAAGRDVRQARRRS